MVHEEKQVRCHLRSLATKLIEEVDTLRSQTTASQQISPNLMLLSSNQLPGGSQLPAGQLTNVSANSAVWKNRCSERRDRINAQNMQIALEKEFQAKEQLIEENSSLKHELDTRQNRINDLHAQIEQLNAELGNNQNEIKALKEELNGANCLNTSTVSNHYNNIQHIQQQSSNSMSSLSSSSNTNNLKQHHETNKPVNDGVTVQSQLTRTKSNVSTNSSTIYSMPPNENENSETTNNDNVTVIGESAHQKIQQVKLPVTAAPVNGHKFEVVTFNTIERCEYCCGILYGICRQAVRCQHKQCRFLCHPKCRAQLPANCPININQRVQLKGVDFARGIGTLMVGLLKIPKLGGVKKGWIDHHVYLSNARLFVCPIHDNKPSIIPSQIIDIKDPNFSVSKVTESDVIHASKKDIPCILKMVVTKLKNQHQTQPLLFCAKDEKDRNSWINVLRDLNERLIQAHTKNINTNSVPLLPIEAKEICDASTIRNAYAACIYDQERLLIASDEGIDVIDIKTDCTIHRIHDKKTFAVDVFREEKLIVSISGKNHQIFMFPTIVIEGIVAEPIKIDETKNCNLFCLGKLSLPVYASPNEVNTSITSGGSVKITHLLCVAIKKVVSIYEVNSGMKPKWRKLREVELTMVPQSIQIINSQLCIGFQSEFALYSLAKETAPIALLQPDRDRSLQFLIKDPINALMAVQISADEYLLVFESEFIINSLF